MERSKRARRRKLDTAKTDLKPPLVELRRAGCPSSEYRKMESEGPAEKYRAVIDGVTPEMNRSAQGGARSSLHFRDEGVLIHPPHQGVCGRHGTEEQRVTSGELTESPGGTGVSGPISRGEVASDALSVVGRLNSGTHEQADQANSDRGDGGAGRPFLAGKHP